MSIIGLDVGTSAVKAAAYADDGLRLAVARRGVVATSTAPGLEELDPEEVWQAMLACLGELAAAPRVRADPPRALAIAASGDEVFPVDAIGQALAPCILSGDARGAEIEGETLARRAPAAWYAACGHVPERMDPANRYRWLMAQAPEAMRRARRLTGWHEFLTLRLVGRAVTDPSLAAKWAVFDLDTGTWSHERLIELDLADRLLPEILPWGSTVGEVANTVAREVGLPPGVIVGVGGYDSTCAALGAGAIDAGIAGLACGSWEVVVAPQADRPAPADQLHGFPTVPHPGTAPWAILAQSPNGAAVAGWVAGLTGLELDRAALDLAAAGPGPGHLLAIPHLSGALGLWSEGRRSRGLVMGLTLASRPLDLLRAFLEAVAYELALTLEALEQGGRRIDLLRATGGGTRSPWWMQLKADMTGLPIEVTAEPEPGALGAALLARCALTGQERIATMPPATKPARFEPCASRQALHQGRLAHYRSLVEKVLAMQATA